MAPSRQLRVIIEKVIALQFEKRLRDLQFPHIRHRMRHVIELRGIVDRSEEPRQVVEKCVVAPADKSVYLMTAGRLHTCSLVGRDEGRKASAGKADKPQVRPAVAVDRYPNLRWPQYFQILLFDSFEIGQQPGEAGVIAVRTGDTAI